MADSLFVTLVATLALSLAFTLIIEVGMAMVMGVWEPKDCRTVVKVNCITNPIVVSLMFLCSELTRNPAVRNSVTAVLEITVVWVEMLLYRKWPVHGKKNPFVFSLVLNASSFGIGVVFGLFLLWIQ